MFLDVRLCLSFLNQHLGSHTIRLCLNIFSQCFRSPSVIHHQNINSNTINIQKHCTQLMNCLAGVHPATGKVLDILHDSYTINIQKHCTQVMNCLAGVHPAIRKVLDILHKKIQDMIINYIGVEEMFQSVLWSDIGYPKLKLRKQSPKMLPRHRPLAQYES